MESVSQFFVGWFERAHMRNAIKNEFSRNPAARLKLFVGLKLFVFAALGLTFSVNIARAARSCHIHPLGVDAKNAEARIVEWYKSLEECELANKKLFGGLGICHCLPDGIFGGTSDDEPFRRRHFGLPQDPSPE
jgi:hypothetical protein